MDVYERIDEIILNKSITIHRMCVDTGISYSAYMANYHRKSRKLPFEVLKALSSYLEVSIDFLLGNDDLEKAFLTDKDTIEHFHLLKMLNKSGRDKATQYLKDIMPSYCRKPRNQGK